MPIINAPERSREQREIALQHANEIRTSRAQLKRDIRAGHVSIVTVVLDPPAWAASAKVVELLLAVPKYGRVKSYRALDRSRISLTKTLAGMTARQRTDLAVSFGATADQLAASPWLHFPQAGAAVRRPARDPDMPTDFQERVLALAVSEFGEVGPVCIDDIAARLGTDVSSVSSARTALVRGGLLEPEFGRPTGVGRRHARSIHLPDPPAAAGAA